jgi:hypothetical protein
MTPLQPKPRVAYDFAQVGFDVLQNKADVGFIGVYVVQVDNVFALCQLF